MQLDIEEGKTGLFFVTSPDERGLLVAGRSLADVLGKVAGVLEELREAHASVHPRLNLVPGPE